MRALLAMVLLLAWCGCRKPEPMPPPKARLIVRFLDRDALLDLAILPSGESWRVMNAGQWEALAIRWKPGPLPIGAAVVGRTASDWVLLEDPAGDIHRIVMRGPGPEELAQRNADLTPETREALGLLGVLWLLGWVRH